MLASCFFWKNMKNDVNLKYVWNINTKSTTDKTVFLRQPLNTSVYPCTFVCGCKGPLLGSFFRSFTLSGPECDSLHWALGMILKSSASEGLFGACVLSCSEFVVHDTFILYLWKQYVLTWMIIYISPKNQKEKFILSGRVGQKREGEGERMEEKSGERKLKGQVNRTEYTGLPLTSLDATFQHPHFKLCFLQCGSCLWVNDCT